ncbi:hypothetical protein D9758_009470 [Tetrapyrgos nigripes]|uniref:Protein kinase domain-containing protein n=1 Tax=Tetrapyrgos nigripes TaxID=182062 RepID=A0A8H5G140_9AGAR|nr:hypothetical protein D9758_009470 [Tetrapyrgos nigripes]
MVKVAIKLLRVLSSNGYDEVKARKRLNREVYVWHRLEHPNIVTFLGTSYHMSGRPALVLPWFSNGCAPEYLRRNPHVDRLQLILDVARGLHYLHTKKPSIVHGDLKGNNILITDDGRATLSDFGLAQVIEQICLPQCPEYTPSGGVGPIRWQAPEFLQDDTGHPKMPGDIWSFGCTCYEYISGRFSTGYRATIGADFITKVLPHPSKEGETVTLQIWDTAGQERFSSLSSAFFRGADAAVLMFDVNSHETMEALTKWWDQFKNHAPLSDDEMGDFCCVVVGNKLDLLQKDGHNHVGNGSAIRLAGHLNGTKKKAVSREEAESFLKELVPPEFVKPVSVPEVEMVSEEEEIQIAEELEVVSEDDEDPLSASQATIRPHSPEISLHFPSVNGRDSSSDQSTSIAINGRPLSPLDTRTRTNSSSNNSPSSPSFIRHLHRHKSQSKSRSRSANSRYYSGVSSSGFSIYHTPSSSVYDQFDSARSSPEPWEPSPSSGSPLSSSYTPVSLLRSPSPASMNNAHRAPRRRLLSAGNKSILSIDSMKTRSTSSVATVTPSFYARGNEDPDDDWDQDNQGTVGSSAGSFFSALSRSFSSASIAPALLSEHDSNSTSGGANDPKLGKFKHSPLRLQVQANHFVPPPPNPPKPSSPEPPDCGPRLFLTSAKTGEGVKDVFEYIAKRVIARWEWEERVEAGRLEFREGEGGDGTWLRSWGRRNGVGKGIKLDARTSGTGRGRNGSANWNSCC